MMGCTEFRERATGAITGGGELPADIAEHMSSCGACAAEITELTELWQGVGRLGSPPSQESTDAIAASLIAQLEQRRIVMNRQFVMAALIGGIVIGGLGATMAGKVRRPSTSATATAPAATPAAEAGQQYLLLLHESPSDFSALTGAQMDSVVGEYVAWAEQLDAGKHLVAAEKLSDKAEWLNPSGELETRSLTEVVSGYYVIRARDADEARALARQSPHLKYGGTIEVRPIEHTGA